jgi:hypothetical protein
MSYVLYDWPMRTIRAYKLDRALAAEFKLMVMKMCVLKKLRNGSFWLTLALGMALIVLTFSRAVSSQAPDDDRLKDKGLLTHEADALPDVLSPAEVALQRERYRESMDLARENQQKWLQSFIASGKDPGSLERMELQVSFSTFPGTLDEAVKQADLIVAGVATNVEFRYSLIGQTWVTFRVEDVAKNTVAQPTGEIIVVFGGGPAPYPGDPSRALLGYLKPAPLLLPGKGLCSSFINPRDKQAHTRRKS